MPSLLSVFLDLSSFEELPRFSAGRRLFLRSVRLAAELEEESESESEELESELDELEELELESESESEELESEELLSSSVTFSCNIIEYKGMLIGFMVRLTIHFTALGYLNYGQLD